MKVELTIPDEMGEFYAHEGQARNQTLAAVMVDRLERAKDLHPLGRYVIVTGKTREALETQLGGGHLLNAEDLLGKVTRIAKIQFGHHQILLTAGQMEELTHRAGKRGKSVEFLIEEIWKKLQAEFFTYVK